MSIVDFGLEKSTPDAIFQIIDWISYFVLFSQLAALSFLIDWALATCNHDNIIFRIEYPFSHLFVNS